MSRTKKEERALRKALWECAKGCTCEVVVDGKFVPKEDRCSKDVMRCNGRHNAWLDALKENGLKHPLDIGATEKGGT
jgi:hypothetical protein